MEFKIVVPKESLVMFATTTSVIIGNGKDTLFWEDRCLDEMRMQDLAPTLYEGVSQRVKDTRTVHEAISFGT